MCDSCKTDRVQPLRFRPIQEVSPSKTCKPFQAKQEAAQKHSPKMSYSESKSGSNFSFVNQYPAISFEEVCFSVDRSQQQANFFYECVELFKNCISPTYLANHSINNKVNILRSVNLSVRHGSIFGLLGPSSCGKTTLLRCLVGLLKPDSGYIRLFCRSQDDRGSGNDFSPEDASSKIPGSNIGYMPQDLGLYEDFTIRQLLTMFGQYVRMESKLIEERIDFMARFLELPDVDRDISTLSGGQKRRVSFAIACLHMPPLIILDEPTVGVDPLLRQSIWKYLRRLADEENKTIIITTHYIEEAAQADEVALMRAGEVLIQDTPRRIMRLNGCRTLEEAFLKICNNTQTKDADQLRQVGYRLNTRDHFTLNTDRPFSAPIKLDKLDGRLRFGRFDPVTGCNQFTCDTLVATRGQLDGKSFELAGGFSMNPLQTSRVSGLTNSDARLFGSHPSIRSKFKERKNRFARLRRTKFVLKGEKSELGWIGHEFSLNRFGSFKDLRERAQKSLILVRALLYKNYRRNVNSLPLLAFQFMLPIIQMISFSLCVGGRPTNIGLGLVNKDQPYGIVKSDPSLLKPTLNVSLLGSDGYDDEQESLSIRYLSFLDSSMLSIKPYDNLGEALDDVRQAKLWAAMEIGENFTTTILKRFDLENFYQLELSTILQSVIKLYPDRSNKVLDMICHRSLISSYRKFLLDQFEHFQRLPVEVKEPIFDIKPNLISNSIDGYTESIAAGLLASLTYIMAAGLTTFIMVVERSAGILERTYTSGINPVAYLLAHAAFRSFVMMIQIAVVMFLTFSILQQPLVGSIWLAYLMLMILNLTGIAYGLLISSIVTDQNGAALTIVSSLVVKITLSGILWPLEAIPRWLRVICYIQPLTMPVQALKNITLKGSGLGDRAVYLGFLVSLIWLVVFLTISARRFKFYQH